MPETKARPPVNDWIPPSMAHPGESVSDQTATQEAVVIHPNGSTADAPTPIPFAASGSGQQGDAGPLSPSGQGENAMPLEIAVNGSKAAVPAPAVNTSGSAPHVPDVSPAATNGTTAAAAPVVSAPPAVPVAPPAAKAKAAAEAKPAEPAPKKRSLPIPLIVLVVFVGAYFVWHYVTNPPADSSHLSGTIEANEIRLASQIGGRVRRVYVKEGDRVVTNQNLIDIYSASGVNESITSPIDGIVLERLIEPGEIALMNSTIMVVADLEALSLTVYVPEDQYGRVQLGQSYNVTVDSFPGQVFSGRVSHIADQAEYTPKNVQTADGRKSTVFGVKLDLDPSGGKLKPGMPADVTFGSQ